MILIVSRTVDKSLRTLGSYLVNFNLARPIATAASPREVIR